MKGVQMGKHKHYAPEFKVQVVLDVLRAQKSQAQICREHNVADELVSRWRQEFLGRAPELFTTARTRSAAQERIAELERLVGQLTLEQSILKKASTLLLSPSHRNGNS
jgi:transposase-like protein